ncbi:MAG TPA: DEAD/DEAH box helicase [Verrucomicrobiae bacterium]|nr:DEAD/DEAH box helicase [Verrucomicrobiae bacterium]
MKLFSELGLSAEILKAVDKLGFEQASPIQAEAIPVLMQGRDVVGQSQTGSGKTAAFGIPAVEKVQPGDKAVQALILCPTRELAVQVSEEIHKLAAFKRGIHALPIYGGQSYDRQFYGLRQGAQIVIGTPGRIMDHMRRGTLRFDSLKMVILDEVDVMLNMGFRDDIELILQSTPKERQTVFFSATIPKPIQQLIEKYSRDPQSIRMEQKAMTVPTVEQVFYEVDRRYKLELLTRLIDIHDLKLGIVFCNTKRMVDDLVDHLNAQGYSADRLHGDMTQAMRDRVMNKFRKSGLEFLVATDVAARGIDVDDVEVVFNYDLPYDAEDYVHRIGRTGRAGRSGRAVSFASGREVFQIRNIERFTNMKIQRGRIPTVTEVEEARANVFLEKVRATLRGEDYKRHERLVEVLLEEGFVSTDIASALMHLLQSGEAAPAKAVQEEYQRPQDDQRAGPRDRGNDRGGRNERGERGDRGDRGIRDDRRGRFDRRDERSADAAPVHLRGEIPLDRSGGPMRHAHLQRDQMARKAEPMSRPVKAAQPPRDPKHQPVAPAASPAPLKAAAPATPVEKTYSDREILESVREPEVRKERSPQPQASGKPEKKASRATPAHQTRLWINLGEAQEIKPLDIVNAVSGETGLPGKVVGTVDVRERHLFVDVDSEHTNSIIAKLNRASIKGHKVKAKVA